MTAVRHVYNAEPPPPCDLLAASPSDSGKDSFRDKHKRRVTTTLNLLYNLLLLQLFCGGWASSHYNTFAFKEFQQDAPPLMHVDHDAVKPLTLHTLLK